MTLARRDPAAGLYLAAVALALVQAGVLGDPARTLRAAVPFAVAAVVVILGRSVRADADETAGRTWLRAVAGLEVGLALWALQAFLRALPAGIGEPSGFYRVKLLVTTPLGDHNTAAGLLLVGVVTTLVLAQDDARWWGGVAVTSTGVVACLSRGAAVVLLAVAGGAWLVGARRRVAVALSVVAVAILGLVLAAAVVLDASPPPGAAVPDGLVGTSLVGRLDLVVRGAEVYADHPVLGVGLGGFGEGARDLPPPNDHAHNALVNAAAEGGTPLLVIVVVLVVLLVWRGLGQPPGWRREVVLLAGAALVLHAQVDIVGGRLGAEFLLAALLALGAAPSHGRGVAAMGVGVRRR